MWDDWDGVNPETVPTLGEMHPNMNYAPENYTGEPTVCARWIFEFLREKECTCTDQTVNLCSGKAYRWSAGTPSIYDDE